MREKIGITMDAELVAELRKVAHTNHITLSRMIEQLVRTVDSMPKTIIPAIEKLFSAWLGLNLVNAHTRLQTELKLEDDTLDLRYSIQVQCFPDLSGEVVLRVGDHELSQLKIPSNWNFLLARLHAIAQQFLQEHENTVKFGQVAVALDPKQELDQLLTTEKT